MVLYIQNRIYPCNVQGVFEVFNSNQFIVIETNINCQRYVRQFYCSEKDLRFYFPLFPLFGIKCLFQESRGCRSKMVQNWNMVNVELFTCLEVILKTILATVGISVLITSVNFKVIEWCKSCYVSSKQLVWQSLKIRKCALYVSKCQITIAGKIHDGTFL